MKTLLIILTITTLCASTHIQLNDNRFNFEENKRPTYSFSGSHNFFTQNLTNSTFDQKIGNNSNMFSSSFKLKDDHGVFSIKSKENAAITENSAGETL